VRVHREHIVNLVRGSYEASASELSRRQFFCGREPHCAQKAAIRRTKKVIHRSVVEAVGSGHYIWRTRDL